MNHLQHFWQDSVECTKKFVKHGEKRRMNHPVLPSLRENGGKCVQMQVGHLRERSCWLLEDESCA